MSDHAPPLPTSIEDTVLPVEREGASRRTFLKLAGFGVAATTLAGCSRGAARLVVPRLDAGSAVTPGLPYLTATTCGGCEASCGILARCRDGRPIKLEGNPDHAISRGGLCAVGQASLLELYDGRRLDGPLVDGKTSDWAQADDAARAALAGANVRVLSRTITSPSTRDWIERLVQKTAGAHIEWDPRSLSALLDAHATCFGVRALPHLRFDRARVIASFDADFLGTWFSPVEHARDYAAGRRPDGDDARMSRHIHIESTLSLTGAAADERLVVDPAQLRTSIALLHTQVAVLAGATDALGDEGANAPNADRIGHLANELWGARGHSLVVCGSGDSAAQALVVHINQLLGNYGQTLDLERPSLARRGDDRALHALVKEMEEGQVDVLIIDRLDPLYELPESLGIRAALARVGTVISTSPRLDETAAVSTIVVPTPHELESWNDAEAVLGHLSLSQPTVPPLRSTRSFRASLAAWMDAPADDLDLIKSHWQTHVHPRARSGNASAATLAFETFFDRVLHDGYVAAQASALTQARWRSDGVKQVLTAHPRPTTRTANAFALVLYSKVGLPEGRNAHNPWLQELPDPLTTLVWDNYACMSPAAAAKLGVRPGDVVRIAAGDTSVELPVRTLPGIHDSTVAVALGYGVAGTDRFSRIGPSWLEGRLTVREGETVGRRAAQLLELDGNGLRTSGRAVSIVATGAHADLAGTQDHHRLEVPEHLAVRGGAIRTTVLATSFEKLRKDPAHALDTHGEHDVTLWPPDHTNDGPRYGLAIDLAACNGCSGCVVACQAENNVPSVGKDEVLRHREMTWLRMDRYFQGSGKALRVHHQPMMCHHCANAPCETVCPVLATAHSSDGLNQQVYNRCVGTRYCANNCPYKVRRFNWFDYPRDEDLNNLALNPDVTVRSRGVMEKCSMCVQRIQEGKSEAARRGTPLKDGEVQTACQQSCPTNAIVFGDLHDPESSVAQLARTPRAYQLLSELNVAPGVAYLADVRNAPEPESTSATGESHG